MGVSASLLDEAKSNYIKGEVKAELEAFSPFFRRQFSLARFSELEEDLQQNKDKITQLLKQREAPESGEVLYEEGVLFFDDTRKWRERYVVVRANYCLECHDSLESFVKGVPPRQKLLPTGGAVLTTEEKYMAMVDKCFPDNTGVSEDFAPPLSGMPGQFPVYLRLPFRRDSYFCFRQQSKQDGFLSILSDCIRHQNQDFLKKKSCEVQAFLKAIRLFRQERGQYEAWDMLIGSDVRVMANLVMEKLLPSLEKDLLPGLKAKKTERKRVWFATVEAAYILIQESLLEGLSALKEECRVSVRQQDVHIHSDMDQIVASRRRLEERIRAKVSAPAERLCSERVQPYLGSVLEELMEPISCGFLEGRQLCDVAMATVCQDDMLLEDNDKLKEALVTMARPNLLSCFMKISSLQEKLRLLEQRFGFTNISGVIHSAQIDLQQLVENASFTFEQLLHKAVQDNSPSSAMEKARHRVLKQYDYDSSTVRKRISREALVSITLPFIKKNLLTTCRPELQSVEELMDSDHSSFIHVENVYEDILLQTLDTEVNKVVKEAASLQKYNLFTDSRDLLSESSRSSLSSPSVSTPSSPAMTLAFPADASTQRTAASGDLPLSPLATVHGLSSCQQKDEDEGIVFGVAMETPLGNVAQKTEVQSVTVDTVEEVKTPKADDDVAQTVVEEEPTPKEEENVAQTVAPVILEAEIPAVETQAVNAETPPEIITKQEEQISVKAEETEPLIQTPKAPQEAESMAAAVAPSQTLEEASNTPTIEPEITPASETAAEEVEVQCSSLEIECVAPSSGETRAVTPADVNLDMKRRELDVMSGSDANSMNVSIGSDSPHASDVESINNLKTTPNSSGEEEEEEGSTTSDVLDDGENATKSPVSSDDATNNNNDGEITQVLPGVSVSVSGSVEAEKNASISTTSDLVEEEEGKVTEAQTQAAASSENANGEKTTIDDKTTNALEGANANSGSVEEAEKATLNTPEEEKAETATVNTPAEEKAETATVNTPTEEKAETATVNTPAEEKAETATVNTPAEEKAEKATVNTPTEEKAETATLNTPAEEKAEKATVNTPTEEEEEEVGQLSECEALDSIRAIRDLVEEVIEVEELVKRYPSGVPMEE